MTDDDYKILQPTIPAEPGVYQFIDAKGVILYVGKAKNLKNRLATYFGARTDRRQKTEAMVRNAVTFRFTIVESETDALLMEAAIVREQQPKYNVMLKSGDGYPYICITNERFPRVQYARRATKNGGEFFGPYPSGKRVNGLLDLVRNLFQLRTCNFALTDENIKKGKFKICLEYHIKKCAAPCTGLQTEAEYNETVAQIKNMLKGNFGAVAKHLRELMQQHAEKMEFERAQIMKQRLALFEDYQGKSTVANPKLPNMEVYDIVEHENNAYVNFMTIASGAVINTFTVELVKNLNQEPNELLAYAILDLRKRFNSQTTEIIVPFVVESLPETIVQSVPKVGDKKKLLDLCTKNVLYYKEQQIKQELLKVNQQSSSERVMLTLKQDLRMTALPQHIECFDNSNFQGSFPVSSCVVFRNAKPAKREYRHFNVKTVEGIDDFASMEEVVFRRYRRLINEGASLPQLIVIDGGKGQLGAAVKSLTALGILDQVKVVGIAKKLEEIYFPGDSTPLHINKKSESLKVIQQIRNEAHRFGITFHRDQRSRGFIITELNDIPGVGDKTSEKLLTEFGSVRAIKEASLQALIKIAGKKAAQTVFEFYLKAKKEEEKAE
jgi:excinuclease ABC subunit C